MQASKSKLKEYINQYLSLWDFYGVIQVLQKGEVLFEEAYGFANIEFNIKNDVNSCFSLASMSKQFTAFAIMILYEKGLLDIDKPAQLYLPEDMKIENSITVHHLLSHTSGLHNFYNFESDFFNEYNKTEYSRNDFFTRYINKRPTSPPGLIYDYNNSNYNLLAWMIEHVSGEKYEDYIRNNIFQPLDMKNSDVDDGYKPIKNRSYNYSRDFDEIIKSPYHNEKYSIGAGAIVSNCADLFKWYTCLRNRKILSTQSYARFFKVNKDNYCYGLEHHRVYGTDRYSHGGDHLGIGTYMQNYFNEDICIIILSNNEAINQYRLGNAISNILFQVDVDAPTKYKEMTLNDSKLNEYCGTYLKDKIEVERMNGKMYFTRFKGNLHIEIYPIDEGKFVRRFSDQLHPYTIDKNENGKMTFFGYVKE